MVLILSNLAIYQYSFHIYITNINEIKTNCLLFVLKYYKLPSKIQNSNVFVSKEKVHRSPRALKPTTYIYKCIILHVTVCALVSVCMSVNV